MKIKFNLDIPSMVNEFPGVKCSTELECSPEELVSCNELRKELAAQFKEVFADDVKKFVEAAIEELVNWSKMARMDMTTESQLRYERMKRELTGTKY